MSELRTAPKNIDELYEQQGTTVPAREVLAEYAAVIAAIERSGARLRGKHPRWSAALDTVARLVLLQAWRHLRLEAPEPITLDYERILSEHITDEGPIARRLEIEHG